MAGVHLNTAQPLIQSRPPSNLPVAPPSPLPPPSRPPLPPPSRPPLPPSRPPSGLPSSSQTAKTDSSSSSQMIMGVVGIIVVLIIGFFMFLSSTGGDGRGGKQVPTFKVNERMIQPIELGISQIETPKLSATANEEDAVFQEFVEGSKIKVEFIQEGSRILCPNLYE